MKKLDEIMYCPEDDKPCPRPLDELGDFQCSGTYVSEAEDELGNLAEPEEGALLPCPRWTGAPGGGWVRVRDEEQSRS